MDDTRASGYPLYPMFLDLTSRRVLVVGGGGMAERRVLAALEAGSQVTIVAIEATSKLRGLADSGRVELLVRSFTPQDVVNRDLVFSATGKADVDAAVANAARSIGSLVNVADDIGLSDFHVPAVERRGDIQVAVSTGGTAPGLAARLRDRFASALGPEWERFARILGEVRGLARTSVTDRDLRMRAMRVAAHDQELLAEIARGHEPTPAEVLHRAMRPLPVENHSASGTDREAAFVSIVGAGPGDPTLITVAGLERLREAEVVVYDDLVDRRLLAEAPISAELVYHGKRGWELTTGRPGGSLVVERARHGAGRRVVRLKGGDPSVFGRLDEELFELREAGISHEVIPGVTAASAAAAAACIPLTKRGVAAHVTLVTGVGAGDQPGEAAEVSAPLLQRGGTVALYMGHRHLGDFTRKLLDAGVPSTMPAVVVSDASNTGQRIVRSSVADIAEKVRDSHIGSPALAMFGAGIG